MHSDLQKSKENFNPLIKKQNALKREPKNINVYCWIKIFLGHSVPKLIIKNFLKHCYFKFLLPDTIFKLKIMNIPQIFVNKL